MREITEMEMLEILTAFWPRDAKRYDKDDSTAWTKLISEYHRTMKRFSTLVVEQGCREVWRSWGRQAIPPATMLATKVEELAAVQDRRSREVARSQERGDGSHINGYGVPSRGMPPIIRQAIKAGRDGNRKLELALMAKSHEMYAKPCEAGDPRSEENIAWSWARQWAACPKIATPTGGGVCWDPQRGGKYPWVFEERRFAEPLEIAAAVQAMKEAAATVTVKDREPGED